MNVEIGTEGAQFPEKEYINGIFLEVQPHVQISMNLRFFLLSMQGTILIELREICNSGGPTPLFPLSSDSNPCKAEVAIFSQAALLEKIFSSYSSGTTSRHPLLWSSFPAVSSVVQEIHIFQIRPTEMVL
jgi:hypothetical protein